jgi:hypothetical protein
MLTKSHVIGEGMPEGSANSLNVESGVWGMIESSGLIP